MSSSKPDPGIDQSEAQEAIREIVESYPGLRTEVVTFLGDRFSESLTGETAAVVVNVFGDDLDALDATGARIAAALGGVDGHRRSAIRTAERNARGARAAARRAARGPRRHASRPARGSADRVRGAQGRRDVRGRAHGRRRRAAAGQRAQPDRLRRPAHRAEPVRAGASGSARGRRARGRPLAGAPSRRPAARRDHVQRRGPRPPGHGRGRARADRGARGAAARDVRALRGRGRGRASGAARDRAVRGRRARRGRADPAPRVPEARVSVARRRELAVQPARQHRGRGPHRYRPLARHARRARDGVRRELAQLDPAARALRASARRRGQPMESRDRAARRGRAARPDLDDRARDRARPRAARVRARHARATRSRRRWRSRCSAGSRRRRS